MIVPENFKSTLILVCKSNTSPESEKKNTINSNIFI